MKTRISIITLLLSFASFSQMTAEETTVSREEHAKELSDTTYEVLNQVEIDAFHGLDYYHFNKKFQIDATFTKSVGKVFEMPTSTDRTPKYRRYGYLDFEVEGIKCRLEVYQNMRLRKKKEYKDYLFLPFRDLTSSNETYGGGRFLDVRIPKEKSLIIDFNQAYNPYCAYSYRYSCPIPPACNTLNVKIEAGEKVPLGH